MMVNFECKWGFGSSVQVPSSVLTDDILRDDEGEDVVGHNDVYHG